MFGSAIDAIDILLKAVDDDMKDKLDKDEYADPDYTIDEMNKLEDKITDLLDDERKIFTDGLSSADIEELSDIIEKLKDNDNFDEVMYNEAKNFFDSVLPKFTEDYITALDDGLLFLMLTDRTKDWVDSWSYELGQLMKLYSHSEVDRILSNAMENGDGVQDVIQELMDSYGFSRERARRTAITEMLRAHSYAKDEAIRQSPAVDRVEWKHSGAHKIEPRKHHQELDGTIIKKDEKFVISAPTGTYEAKFPRDVSLPASETIYCHCTHRGIVNDDIMGLSIEERRKLQQEAIDSDNVAWEKELDTQNKAKAGIE